MSRSFSLSVYLVAGLLVLSACAAQPPAPSSPPTAAATQAAPTQAPATAAPQATPTNPPLATVTQAAPTSVPTIAPTQEPSAPAAKACASPANLTPAMTEGPYFKTGSPERTSLLTSGMAGMKLLLTGYVLSADCKPVANALLEFWQADSFGVYDNAGYTLRGHQTTGADGSYRLETVVPGLYPGRTEHIHVKVQAPGGPALTSQLFFPGVQQNDSDGIYDERLLMQISQTDIGLAGSYTFIINTQ